MISILICDNNPIFADYLKQEVEQLLPVPCRVSVCHSSEALRQICTSDPPGIALMDIHLGDSPENGITLARELFPASSDTSVIFITGYIEYVSDVYEADHIYFIRKPVEKEYLRRALDKALEGKQTKAPIFSMKIQGTTQLIDLREVLCVESFYRKLRFRMWNETLECYGSFSGDGNFSHDPLSQKLPCQSGLHPHHGSPEVFTERRFVRSHQPFPLQ